jgi:transposase-like protein
MLRETKLRYSEAFKLQVVRELETGKLRGFNEGRERYGIGGSETIQRWMRKYGKNHLLAKLVHVPTPNEKNRLRELMQENNKLKRALADARMKSVLYESWLYQ